jgi:hypothetical protein
MLWSYSSINSLAETLRLFRNLPRRCKLQKLMGNTSSTGWSQRDLWLNCIRIWIFYITILLDASKNFNILSSRAAQMRYMQLFLLSKKTWYQIKVNFNQRKAKIHSLFLITIKLNHWKIECFTWMLGSFDIYRE